MCGPSQARCFDFDHCPGVVNFLGSVSNTQRQIPAMYIGNEWRKFEGGHLIPRLEVFDICRYGFPFLQQLVLLNRIKQKYVLRNGEVSDHDGLYHLYNALLTLAGLVESDLRHLRHFAFSITSGFSRTVIYRDEEYENINNIFPKDYGATQINFIKSLVVDMMGYLPQLDAMCILPNGEHFYQGKRVLGDGPINVEDLKYLEVPPCMFPLSLEHQLILPRGDRRLPSLGPDDHHSDDLGPDFDMAFFEIDVDI
ncbi:hypothetical protein FACUT_13917 [Fusarium acutatum]|uniref:Uncharacterized protein n=1 Tax=Fusarium acutatum TaxID=78861 RepID=A0A8H4N872_9HYPO|nr:hypothetical protein FACUT_13917 [Fusarium acutatum]